jgi:antitoxin HicB
MKNRHIGSTLQEFLEEEGIAEEVNAAAIKHVLAWQIEQAMKAQAITKSEMAKRMRTSRTQLERLLDPANDKVSLETMHRAAAAVGKRLVVGLQDLGKAAA